MSPVQLQAILAALACASARIRVTNLKGVADYVAPARAAALVRTERYFVRVRNGHVTSLREVAESPAVRDDGYRIGLPVIQPSIEWSRRMGYSEWQRRLECA